MFNFELISSVVFRHFRRCQYQVFGRNTGLSAGRTGCQCVESGFATRKYFDLYLAIVAFLRKRIFSYGIPAEVL
jgi:hypothetical protein